MENLTFEQCSRLYGQLGGFKTTQGMYSLFRNGDLEVEAADQADRRFSIYQYRVPVYSFTNYLQRRGFGLKEIRTVLPRD